MIVEIAPIKTDSSGKRICICPICDNEIILADDELAGDTILCDICENPIELID